MKLATRLKISATLKRKGIRPPPGSMRGKVQSVSVRKKIGRANSGRKNGQYKTKGLGYGGVHIWLRKKFGSPKHCEVCDRKDKKAYDWAKKTGKNYTRRRSNFLRLCRGCHQCYDYANGDRGSYAKDKNINRRQALQPIHQNTR